MASCATCPKAPTIYTCAMSEMPSPTAASPQTDPSDWTATCVANLQAHGLVLNDKAVKAVAKGLARMAQVGPTATKDSHRDFNLTLQQVRHV
jgi:hypothetical protein